MEKASLESLLAEIQKFRSDVEGPLKVIDSRLSALHREMDSRFNSLNIELDARFVAIDQRFAGIDQHLARIEHSLETVAHQMSKTVSDVTALKKRLDQGPSA